MLMLIPLAMISAITVAWLIMADVDVIEANASVIHTASQTISLHHTQALKEDVLVSGFVEPDLSAFAPIEAMTTYAHVEENVIFFISWPTRMGESPIGSEGSGSRFDDAAVRQAVSRSASAMQSNPRTPGETRSGDFLFLNEAFSGSVGGALLPFDPGIEDGTPVIMTVVQRGTP